MATQTLLALDGATQFATGIQPDSNQTLLSLAEQYKDGTLKRAPHQRKNNAWNEKKQKDWIDRCRDVVCGRCMSPLGTVCLYKVTDEGCVHQYLNDGLQRVSSAVLCRECPSNYGYRDKEEVDAILRSTFIYVQNRVYNDHKSAVLDFVAVNNGTGLEPAEKHRHHLEYADGWDSIWSSQVERWKIKLANSLASFCKSSDRRTNVLSRGRLDLQLFAVAHCGKPKFIGLDDELEKIVVSCFSHSSPKHVSKLIAKMESFIAEIELAWRKIHPDPQRQMHASLARWCIGIMFLNEHLSPKWWQTFFERLFTETGGNALLSYKDNDGRSGSVNLGKKLECFNRVCRILSIEINETPKRSKHNILVKSGNQLDHVDPFCDNGEGELQFLPARLNAAKNARKPL